MKMAKVKELFEFEIDYKKVKKFELTEQDIEDLKLEQLSVVRKLRKAVTTIITAQSRPDFPDDLQYFESYSANFFPKGKVAIYVNKSIYTTIRASIEQYIKDLADEGYYATAYTVTGDSAVTLRNHIRNQSGIVGSLMVGNLPYIAYEDSSDSSAVEVFPCDLYFMDTNGTWTNTDSDTNIEKHTGNVAPEIWVGRLWTPTNNGNDTALLKDYFRRNHNYRKGLFGCTNRGLSFVDDDWTSFGDCGLKKCLNAADICTVVNKEDTNENRYKAELSMHRLWSQVCAHSNTSLHAFRVSSGNGYVYSSYIKNNSAPKAYYYNLFACRSGKYTSSDYIGGWYIFDYSKQDKCYGLAAIASAKTGSMLYFENFYGSMGKGLSIGDAMVQWWKCLGSTHEISEISWHYGLSILGDPTLTNLSGAVPNKRTPADGTVFEHYPRLTHLSWDPVALPNVTYEVQTDYYYGVWNYEYNKASINTIKNIKNTYYDTSFVGAQRGRWRVRAVSGNVPGPWSDWGYFRYLH